jgi:hypothetical protein
MSNTITNVEDFPKGTPEERMKVERQLKLDAGAISSEYEGNPGTGWKLTTVWRKMDPV